MPTYTAPPLPVTRRDRARGALYMLRCLGLVLLRHPDSRPR